MQQVDDLLDPLNPYLVSSNAVGVPFGGGDSYGPDMTPDGRFIAFTEAAGVTGADTAVYLWDAQSGARNLVSANTSGTLSRFSTADYASYCRCVGSQKLSNGKKKGSGNTKNGNKYLAWAFVEAANFAIRYNARIKSFYQRKKAKSHGVLAIKAVAHKLCRACYYIVRDQVPFDVAKAFA